MAIPAGVDQSLIKYFTLTWAGLISNADSAADPDDKPDLDNLTGTVTFKPTLTQPLQFKNVPQPFTLAVLPRTITLGADGNLNDQGRAYIKLEASVGDAVPVEWYWRATFSLMYKGTPVTISPVVFMGAPGTSIDLTNMLVAGISTESPTINDPTGNTFTHNLGGVRGFQRITLADYNALPTPRNPEVVYIITG